MNCSVAYSPCPNDTFMFHDLARGALALPDRTIEVHLHDVETLNCLALEATYDITKLSFYAWLLVRDRYERLAVGAAVGDCGPVVVAARPLKREDLAACRIAVPGRRTTAHLLLQLWAPQASNKHFTRYDRIIDLVATGRVDAGLLIHEGRFVADQAGLYRVADLGQWWQEQTGLPVPLGCIAARKSLGAETIRTFETLLTRSIEHALARPAETMDYVRQHAREMDEAVLTRHIQTFVNAYSLDLGDCGRAAVGELQRRAQAAGILE